ncbi:MAG: hypothetical protein FH749_09290 [Firmicutes bacterium]|nr:hypothetical protein [Bacillota bacterium]
MEGYISTVIIAGILGGLLRILILRSDYRQYPTYPHGYISHMSLGFIAAGLGAVALPALLAEEYVAVTFLALAAQQFRDIRNIERETLSNLDKRELVPRGDHFIEGIARAFEARNFMVMGCSLALSILDILLLDGQPLVVRIGVMAGAAALLLFFMTKVMEGKRLGHIAKVKIGEIRFEGPNLFVDDVHFMNLGLEEIKEVYLEHGLGLIIEPRSMDSAATLANTGQRQAIAHICAMLLGVYKDVDTAEFTPLVRRQVETGKLGLVIVPDFRDETALLKAVEKIPVLEGSVSRPSETSSGQERRPNEG